MDVRIIIDGSYISAFGMVIVDGSLEGLMNYPPMKQIPFNDWKELQGIEVDVSNPILNSQNLTVTFGSTSEQGMNDFLNLIGDASYHRYRSPELNLDLLLRAIGVTRYNNVGGLYVFSVTYSNDNPLYAGVGSNYANGNIAQDFNIDNTSLSNWSVFVREGTKTNLEKRPDFKEHLIITNNVTNGQTFDPINMRYKQIVTDLYLNIQAPAENFYQNYLSFFNMLVQPGLRKLESSTLNYVYDFYYNSSNIQKFTITNNIAWCDFIVNITVPVPPFVTNN